MCFREGEGDGTESPTHECKWRPARSGKEVTLGSTDVPNPADLASVSTQTQTHIQLCGSLFCAMISWFFFVILFELSFELVKAESTE